MIFTFTDKILLKNEFPQLDTDATIDVYVQTENEEFPVPSRPAMVVFPGGGYYFTSRREAEPVALAFSARGYQSFVLNYSCAPSRYPLQLLEAAATVALIRRNAKKWNVDKNKVSVVGFSAGGHLAACLGTLFNDQIISSSLALDGAQVRPDAMVLSYPLIDLGTHHDSTVNLLGEDPSKALIHKMALYNNVTEDTPPAFIWTTANDEVVPSENSLEFALALKKHNVPYEIHVFRDGVHGMSLANEEVYSTDKVKTEGERLLRPRVAKWVNEADCWLDEIYKK